MSIDLRFQLLVIMVDGNVLKVSFDAVGDSFSKVFRPSSSNHVSLNVLLVLTLYQFLLPSKPNELKYIFGFDFPLFHKHCYLSSIQVHLTLLLHNISCCLYKFPQFHFFGVFYNLIFITCLIVFIVFS